MPSKKQSIEEELLEHAIKGQPVLLYGNDPYHGRPDSGRIYLVGKIQVIRKTRQLKKDITESIWGYLDCAMMGSRSILGILTHPRKYDYVKGVLTQKKDSYYSPLEVEPLQGTLDRWNNTISSSCLLFLDNLYCESTEDTGNYERLAPTIEKIKRSYFGDWLVVYTHNPETFPPHFRNQFVEISLESKETKTIGFVGSGTKRTEGETASFPTPPNVKWCEVEMYLIDRDHFKIRIKTIQRTVSYAEMGFKYKTAIKKTELWGVLLRFAMENNSPLKHYNKKEKVEKDIQRLNAVLISYFGISDTPIRYNSKKKGYEAEFKIYDKSFLKEHMNSMQPAIYDEE